jgi:dihydrofolate reductase
MSLDGVVENPTWIAPYLNEEMHNFLRVATEQIDAIVLGRRTYEEFVSYWPNQSSDVPMASFLNDTEKYVISRTLDTPAWANSSLLNGNLVDQLNQLKRRRGGKILIPGSLTLVRSLLRDGLMDELWLLIFPIMLGTGMRLFNDASVQLPLKLVEYKTLGTGVLSVTYQPLGAAMSGGTDMPLV